MVSLQIWTNRLVRECQELGNEGTLVVQGGSARVEEHRLNPQRGACRIRVSYTLSAWAGSLEFDCGIATRYPFDPPVITIVEGGEGLPVRLRSNAVLLLPMAKGWTPSSTIRTCIRSIAVAVAEGGEILSGVGVGVGMVKDDDERANRVVVKKHVMGNVIRFGDVQGSVFPCLKKEEFFLSESQNSPKTVPRFLAVTPNEVMELVEEEEVGGGISTNSSFNKLLKVSRAIPLDTLMKLRFARGESVTIFTKPTEEAEASASITYYMTRSYQCVQAIQDQLNARKIAAHHTHAKVEYHIDRAKEVQARAESTFEQVLKDPALQGIKQAMDLARQAVELYGTVDDDRAQLVMERLHVFLQEPRILRVLEGGLEEGQKEIGESGDGGGVDKEQRQEEEEEVQQREEFSENHKEFVSESGGGVDDVVGDKEQRQEEEKKVQQKQEFSENQKEISSITASQSGGGGDDPGDKEQRQEEEEEVQRKEEISENQKETSSITMSKSAKKKARKKNKKKKEEHEQEREVEDAKDDDDERNKSE